MRGRRLPAYDWRVRVKTGELTVAPWLRLQRIDQRWDAIARDHGLADVVGRAWLVPTPTPGWCGWCPARPGPSRHATG